MLRYRPWFTGAFQVCLIICSLFFAWLLRFDFTLPYRAILLPAIPVLVVVRLVAMAYFGLLRGWWKYVGIRDGIDILKEHDKDNLNFQSDRQPARNPNSATSAVSEVQEL